MSVAMSCSDTILKMIADIMEIPKDDISVDQSFQEIDMTSIGFINLIIKCETEFDTAFEEDKFLVTFFPTIADFISYIEELISSKE